MQGISKELLIKTYILMRKGKLVINSWGSYNGVVKVFAIFSVDGHL